MTTVAIVGKPNVGKSSLFNRLAKEMDAIISGKAGTTRDVKKRVIEIYEQKQIMLIDTGGLEDRNELFNKVKDKALLTASEADLILFMVDGQKFPDDEDIKYFRQVMGSEKPVYLVINKIDNDKLKEMIYEYYELGAKTIFPISVTHNRGVTSLINAIARIVPEEEKVIDIDEVLEHQDDDLGLEAFLENEENQESDEDENTPIKVSIIGKVNVGKSSLLNALVGEERSIVSDVDGTTIDPIDETIIYNEKVITFVDTAGIRRRGKIKDIEKFALLRTEKNLENSNITLVVVDAKNGIAELDEKIAGLVDKHKTGVVIVMNKWDENMMEFKKFEAEVRLKFKFLYYAPILAVSALTGRNIDKLKDMILKVYENYTQRISTSKLNEIIKEATQRHHLPADKTKVVKILFATQFKTKPPTISLVMNRVKLHFSYRRYLINYLRDKFDFTGVPLILIPRKRGENFDTIQDEVEEREKKLVNKAKIYGKKEKK